MTKSVDEMSKSRLVESEEYSGTSSELTESEPGDIEVQSPNVNIRGSLSKHRSFFLTQLYCTFVLN